MWLMGQNSWFNGGYSIGMPVLGMCLNMFNSGNINIPYDLTTPAIMVDRVKALTLEHIPVDDNVIIIGTTTINGNSITQGFTCEFSLAAISQTTSTTLTYAHLRNGIISGLNVASGLTYTLP